MIKFEKGDVVQVGDDEKLYRIEKVIDDGRHAILTGSKVPVRISSLIKVFLKNCQYCGYEPVVLCFFDNELPEAYQIMCPDCKSRTHQYADLKKAFQDWNSWENIFMHMETKEEKQQRGSKVLGKVDLALVPIEADAAIARGFMLGQVKYIPGDWTLGHSAKTLVSAARRHLQAWHDGCEKDESGFDNLDLAITNMAMLIAQKERGSLIDDRPYKDYNQFEQYEALELTHDFKQKLREIEVKKNEKAKK